MDWNILTLTQQQQNFRIGSNSTTNKILDNSTICFGYHDVTISSSLFFATIAYRSTVSDSSFGLALLSGYTIEILEIGYLP